MTSNGYLLLGIPLTMAFQVIVRRRPLRELFAAGTSRFTVDRRGAALALALAVVPGWYAVRSLTDHDWVTTGWYAAATAGAACAAFAIRARSVSSTLRSAALPIAVGAGGMTLVYGTLHIVTGTPLPVGAALVALPTYIALYFPATFLLEEVTFRGALDAHVHHDGETRGWQSAVFTSTLWGLWHLPVSHALPLPLQVTPWGYAWQIVLAVVFGLAAMVVCHTGFGWIRRGADGYDLRRINGVLRHVAGAGIVAAAVVGVAALAVDRPAVVDRLLHLVAFVSVASAASAAMVLLVVIGEQRREAREAAMADIYRRPGEADDDSADR